jgi:hypothetical protein
MLIKKFISVILLLLLCSEIYAETNCMKKNDPWTTIFCDISPIGLYQYLDSKGTSNYEKAENHIGIVLETLKNTKLICLSEDHLKKPLSYDALIVKKYLIDEELNTNNSKKFKSWTDVIIDSLKKEYPCKK